MDRKHVVVGVPSPQLSLFILFATFSLIFLVMQLSGCSTLHARKSKDGPPPFPVDMSKVKPCIPKPEPKSRCGNPASYVVFGKRYFVQDDYHGYCERGTASWYGMAFHQRRTSSGEPFDTLEMTAAHKTLPIPTYAQVTNLENGRKIIVKVNDRGPFCNNRIIDLSYVAAVKLGVYPKGTAYVEVKAIDPYVYQRALYHHRSKCQLASSEHSSVLPTHERYVQIGSFKSEQKAFNTAQKARMIVNMKPLVVKERTSKGSSYLVQIAVANPEQGQHVVKKLRLSGWPNPVYFGK